MGSQGLATGAMGRHVDKPIMGGIWDPSEPIMGSALVAPVDKPKIMFLISILNDIFFYQNADVILLQMLTVQQITNEILFCSMIYTRGDR